MVFLLGLLRVLEFVEFLTTPVGQSVSLGMAMHSLSVRCPFMSFLWTLPFLSVVTIEAYRSLRQTEHQ
ncbi:MAG TPA: hypothetical protein ACFE0H_04620 [Elainellaceae cyanobacterium]